MRRFICLALISALGFVSPAMSQEPADSADPPAAPLTWRQAAAQAGLDEQGIAQLARDKFVITTQEFKQIFDPYVASKLPVFITADSLLCGFHVLYEESVLRLEENNARELPVLLRPVWERLQQEDVADYERPEAVAPALLRARVALGTAMQLFDPEKPVADGDVQELIAAEVAKVAAGTAVEKPAWLGSPDRGFVAIDYSRYTPRGFYTRSPALSRYFQAVSWLQSIPFRVASDEELLAILILGRCARGNKGVEDEVAVERLDAFLSQFGLFVGAQDVWDICTAAECVDGTLDVHPPVDPLVDDLASARELLTDHATDFGDGPTINDQLAFVPDDATAPGELEFRIIAARRIPDGIVFQRTTRMGESPRLFPDSLEVCAALGSPSARLRIEQRYLGVTQIIDQCLPYFSGESLYQQYLDALRALLGAPEPDAPQFLSSAAWQMRSCQTALAGWAQLRHTWALQAKQTYGFFGGARVGAGFIEPEPDFYFQMATLTKRAHEALREAHAFQTHPVVLAEHVDKLLSAFKRHAVATKGFRVFRKLKESNKDRQLFQKYSFFLLGMGAAIDDFPGDEPKTTFVKLAALSNEFRNGKRPEGTNVLEELVNDGIDLPPIWLRLERICRQLEALSHKQLRGVPFTESEDKVIRGYGAELAAAMLYQGNSYLVSQDDAPRIVDVFSDPNSGRVLEVGIGRPRAMYVLYPVGDEEVLCRGAVSTYYEFPSEQRLTDADWKALLDSPQRPVQPDWVPPVVNVVVPEEGEETEEEDDDEGADDETGDEESEAEFEGQ